MKISEILESRGHKVIAGKLADIERRKEPQDGKSPAQMRAEKEKQQKDQKKSSVDEAVDPRLLKYEIKGTKENGQLELFGTTTDFSGSAMKRAIELLNTTKRAVEVSTKGYDSQRKQMVPVNKVMIKPGDDVKSAVLKLKDNQSVDKGVAEGTDKYGYHTSVSNGKFLPSKYGKDKNNLYLHDMDKVSGQLADKGGPQLVTIDDKHIATKIAAKHGGSVEKTTMGTYRVYQPRGARQTTKRPEAQDW